MTTVPSTTTQEMGQQLRAAREARGWTLDEAFFQARTKFPRLKISRSQIAHMERGVDRKRVDYGAAVVLAGLYDLDLAELDAELADEIAALTEALSANSGCTPDLPPRGPFLLSTAA